MNMKRNPTCIKLGISLICGIMVIAFLLLCTIPIRIERELPAVEIRLDDPDYLYPCVVTIQGNYSFNILTDDTFDGCISVSGYKQTGEAMSKITLSANGGPCLYYRQCGGDVANPFYLEYCLGRLECGPFFHRMVICVFSENPLDRSTGWKESGSWGSWNEQHGYCIVPGAETYEDAVQRLLKAGVIRSAPAAQ